MTSQVPSAHGAAGADQLPTTTLSGPGFTAIRAGCGPNLVIFHSLLTDRSAFDAVLPTLAKSYCVTMLNLPGLHGSSVVSGELPAYVDWVCRALDGCGISEKAICLGNGFGGTLALAFAIAHPDRVAALVLCDAVAGFPEEGRKAFRVMSEKVAESGMNSIAEMAAKRVFHPEYLSRHPDAVGERRAVLMNMDPAAFRASCQILESADLLPQVAETRVPIAVICGELDEATPPVLARKVSDAARGRYIEIPQCGHCPPLEMPGAFLSAFAQALAGMPVP